MLQILKHEDIIEAAWNNRSYWNKKTQTAIRAVIEQLDLGQLRVAEPTPNGWRQRMGEEGCGVVFPYQKWNASCRSQISR